MKEKDVIFCYEYNDQHKVFIGMVELIKLIEEKYNQEFWEVEDIFSNKKNKIWIGKPVEWYSPEKLLPKKTNGNKTIFVMVIGYDKLNGYLKYKIAYYDYGFHKWYGGDIEELEEILYWKYLDNPPISLIKNFNPHILTCLSPPEN